MRPPTGSFRRGSPDERSGRGEKGEYRRLLPPRKPNNTPLFIGLGVGGFFILIVIIAVAASGGKTPLPPPPQRAAAPPPAPVDDIGIQNTGFIMWVCAGTERHEDKEVLIKNCPGCGTLGRFYFDASAGAWRCHSCKALVENASLKCADCGRPPRGNVTKLKRKG
jgi:hypothetical protein